MERRVAEWLLAKAVAVLDVLGQHHRLCACLAEGPEGWCPTGQAIQDQAAVTSSLREEANAQFRLGDHRDEIVR